MLGLVSFCMLTMVACGGVRRGGGAAPAAAAAAWTALPSTAMVYYDNSGGIQDSVRMIVREGTALRDVWRQATSSQSSPPPMPEIDFAREMVLVVGAGRMTPDDMVQVDSVVVRTEPVAGTRPKRVMDVLVRTIRGCQTFRSDAYPLAIVRVPRFDGDVRFTERRDRAEGCR